ncbi:MAG TPA: hypothetical protein VFY43_00735 [Candidatus Limnocylindria bacterium]|nr:hypothetical protein [Candidatus Limnocylindria bacterium]
METGIAIDLLSRLVEEGQAAGAQLIEGLTALADSFGPVNRLYQAELLFRTVQESSCLQSRR